MDTVLQYSLEGIAVSATSRDRSLVERAAGGDRDAWRKLRDRHAFLLYAYFSDVVAEAADADELLDETLLRAWCEAGRFDVAGELDPASWLLSLARSVLAARRAAGTLWESVEEPALHS